MKQKEKIEYWQRVGRHIQPGRFFGWFLIINLPIALALSVFIGWHNHLVGEPTRFHLLMRALIALAVFSVGLAIFWHKAIAPAIKAEEETGESKEDDKA